MGTTILPTGAAAAKSLQLCPSLCDPMDGSPPGSPVPGIFQARVLEWGAIAFSIQQIVNHLTKERVPKSTKFSLCNFVL